MDVSGQVDVSDMLRFKGCNALVYGLWPYGAMVTFVHSGRTYATNNARAATLAHVCYALAYYVYNVYDR